MAYRKRRDIRAVRNPEEQTDRLIEEIIQELNNEDGSFEEVEEQARRYRGKKKRRVMFGLILVCAAAFSVFLFIHLQTYTSVRVSDTYADTGAESGNYEQFGQGILKYSRDGISYLNQKGEEQWNQPYQIKNPFIEGNETSAAVADKGGNDIFVFQADGVKGEIHTTLPIQRLDVSKQGIVCAVLKNEAAPKIVCYDTAGNILVEHKASLNGTGYPVDASISPDGTVMQVVYIYTQEGMLTSRVSYYNFGEEGEGKTDLQVMNKEYKGTVMADGFFLSQGVSVSVGDNLMAVYKGKEKPEETAKVKIDKEIKSVFHNEKYIGMILKNEGKGGYELRLYNGSGRQVLSKDFSGEYSNVKICGGQVIMFDGKQCNIFMRSGIKKFQGEMEHHILEMFPVMGVNKYIVMNANGMEHIRLVK